MTHSAVRETVLMLAIATVLGVAYVGAVYWVIP